MPAGRCSHRVDYTRSACLFFLEPLRQISGLQLYQVGRQKNKTKTYFPETRSPVGGEGMLPRWRGLSGSFCFLKKQRWFLFKIFIHFWLLCSAFGISVPWSGIEPGPQQWKPGILTTRAPGNSHWVSVGFAFSQSPWRQSISRREAVEQPSFSWGSL